MPPTYHLATPAHTATSLMAEEPFDTYIKFGFEDETTSFSPPADEQNLPDLVVEILAALQSEPRLPQAEEPTKASTYLLVPAALSAPPSQNTSNFYHPSPTSPDPLGVASDRVYPATYVRPSDTIYVHGALLAAPAPQASSPHQYVPLVSPHPLLAKRPREQWENSSRTDQSPSQKRQRATPFYPSATDIGHPSSSINGLSHSSETVAEGVYSVLNGVCLLNEAVFSCCQRARCAIHDMGYYPQAQKQCRCWAIHRWCGERSSTSNIRETGTER